MLLVNCVGGLSQPGPLTIWGWDGRSWTALSQGGPLARDVGGSAYDSHRDVLVAYGGNPAQSRICSRETWEWDGMSWTNVDAESPRACNHHRLVFDAAIGQTVLVGGQAENIEPNPETWAWDGVTWQQVADQSPPNRAHFGLVFDAVHGRDLLYGGYGYDGRVYGDLWAFADSEWEILDDAASLGPRSHLGMAYDSDANSLVVFGGAKTGASFDSLTDETWVLSGGGWREVETATSPGARGTPGMQYDPVRHVTVLYGGFDGDGNELDDTWLFNGTNWSCPLNCA
jgi:hypothetical protein